MKEFNSINSFALFSKVSSRTIQRRIEKFNSENNTDHKKGLHDPVVDVKLQNFLLNEFNLFNADLSEKEESNVITLYEAKDDVSDIAKEQTEELIEKVSEKLNLQNREDDINTIETTSHLQKKLSSDWLIIVVLLTILCADMIAFGIIGHHNFSKIIPYSHVIFAIIGLATGIGSVVTYNRIKEFKLAEIWKWIFGILQFCVFSFAINENWFLAETVMTLMFVLVFIGVQRSIKK